MGWSGDGVELELGNYKKKLLKVTFFKFISVINDNVMDLQSALVTCSASSTSTEGTRKTDEITFQTIKSS